MCANIYTGSDKEEGKVREKENIRELKKVCVIEGRYCFGKWSSKRPRRSHRSHDQEEGEEAEREGLG